MSVVETILGFIFFIITELFFAWIVNNKEPLDMEVIKTIVFITSLLAIPVLSFLTVLYIITDIVRSQQEEDERGF